MSKTLPTYLYIVGPTATGKTELAIQASERLGWPIVNCDSVQVYQNVDIGTAKPTSEELQRAPHFLFNYISPPQEQTVADYLEDVTQLIKSNSFENVIFVGGSGFYIQALERGLFPGVEVLPQTQGDMESWLDQEGPEALYAWVQEKDPEFAKGISINDLYRLKRAVVVMKSQPLSMTELKKKLKDENHSPLPAHRCVKLGLNDSRAQLRPRVKGRTEAMLEQGLVDEVKGLREQGLQDWAPMRSVGYKEVQDCLDGKFSRADLESRITTATMQLIKKQQTWFKRDSMIQWFAPQEGAQALEWLIEEALPSS